MESVYDEDISWLLLRRPDLMDDIATQEAFSERVAIAVVDGGLTDEMARQQALKELG